jgi:phenylpropionate dioxygenase-like ring-hydroxylating dioxygenase large terminal subunit
MQTSQTSHPSCIRTCLTSPCLFDIRNSAIDPGWHQRLAPLSEGRVDASGQLECAYHGWRFEGSGACVRIPQATDARACSRCRVRTYPTREGAGLLFVWATPDDEERAGEWKGRLWLRWWWLRGGGWW